MKRAFILFCMMFAATFAFAQVKDSTLYQEEEFTYQRPNRNPLVLFGSPYSSHFAEAFLFIGSSGVGYGATYTYLPEVWGGHITGSWTPEGASLMGGASLRLSSAWATKDWQCYLGMGVRHNTKVPEVYNPYTGLYESYTSNYSPMLEAGFRVASANDVRDFSFISTSVGMMTDFQHAYLTIGFSLSVSVIASCFLALALYK